MSISLTFDGSCGHKVETQSSAVQITGAAISTVDQNGYCLSAYCPYCKHPSYAWINLQVRLGLVRHGAKQVGSTAQLFIMQFEDEVERLREPMLEQIRKENE